MKIIAPLFRLRAFNVASQVETSWSGCFGTSAHTRSVIACGRGDTRFRGPWTVRKIEHPVRIIEIDDVRGEA